MHELAHDRDEGHRRGKLALARALFEFVPQRFRRHSQRGSHHLPLGHVAAKAFPPLADVLHFWAVVRGPIERRLRDLVVRDGDAEAGAEKADFVLVELFLLMGNVLALAGLAHAVALDGLGEDDGGCVFVGDGLLVGGIDLFWIVAAAPHFLQLFVRVVLDHRS